MSVIPWRSKAEPPSIYEHIRSHVRPGESGLAEGGEKLPDDELVRAEGKGIAWAPGAREGVFARYLEQPESVEERITQVHAALVRLADHPGHRTRARVRRLFREDDVRSVIDAILERVSNYPPNDQARLYVEMKRVLLESGHREEVKFATALVGAFRNPEDADIFRTLARHEEFTLYAAVALANVVDDPVPEWIDLLQHLSGWGKTELSAFLLQDPRPEVCECLLRRGLGIGNALELAVGCKLHQALSAPKVDNELFDGAGAILDSLTWAGDSPSDLFDYPDAGLAVERFLTHLNARARTLDHFMTTYEIHRYLKGPSREEQAKAAELFEGLKEDEEDEDKRREAAGFNETRMDHVLELCTRILERPEWPSLAAAALESEEEHERWLGIQVAKRLGMSLHDYLVSQIEARPNNSGLWFEFAHGADGVRIDETISLAERVLNLDAVATGPALELMGPFEEAHPHQAFDFVLQELPRFPGKGWNLLRVGLRSPVIRHRLVALRALSHWPAEQVTPSIRSATEECLDDPDEGVREAARAVLSGEPMPER